MKRIVKVFVLLICSIVVCGGNLLSAERNIPRGARIFIEEMSEDLDGYIRAEMISKKVPLTVVLKREDAHIVMVGSSKGTEKRAWHEGWLTTVPDRATGNIMIFDRTSKSMLWAGEAGDRSLWWGSMARGGQRKVASRLVNKIKDAVTKKEQPITPPPPLSAEEITAGTSVATISAGQDSSILNNDDIIKMMEAGIGDELIISRIRNTQCVFHLETDSIVALKKAGVSDAVLGEMLQK